MKNDMQNLIGDGLFSNQAEIMREGIRKILLKYNQYQKKNENVK